MSLDYDAALGIAKRTISSTTGDSDPKIIQFNSENGFQFAFDTVKGKYHVALDKNGSVLSVSGLDGQASQRQPQSSAYYDNGPKDDHRDLKKGAGQSFPNASVGRSIDAETAGRVALESVGGRKVESVRSVDDGYEVTVTKGMMKKFVVQVDSKGKVVSSNRSRITDNLDLDIFD